MTIPRWTRAGCVDCGALRAFRASDGDSEAAVGIYECTECGHQIRLDLDP